MNKASTAKTQHPFEAGPFIGWELRCLRKKGGKAASPEI